MRRRFRTGALALAAKWMMEPITENTMTEAVLKEIAAEREKQVAKWGNEFDDANTSQDWAAFIMHYLAVGQTTRLGAAPGRPFRESMVKVATLAIAAIEAHDRKPPF